MPVVCDLLDVQDRDRVGADQRVEPVAQAVRGHRPGDIDMGGHGQRVDPGVGPARGGEHGLLAGHALKCLFQRLLDRRAMILALPAHERPAVIFDR